MAKKDFDVLEIVEKAAKKLLSDELYNNYVSQLKVLSAKKQKNIMLQLHNI